jgi:hypothetical protein
MWKRNVFLVLLAMSCLVGCANRRASAAVESGPVQTGWNASLISNDLFQCNQSITSQLSDPSRANAICTCWVGTISSASSGFSVVQVESGDPGVTDEVNADLAQCAAQQGESL